MTHPKDTPATSGSADQAVSHAKEEVRYCYEELHGRRPLEVGHGGHLTYGDLEVLIQAAEEVAELRKSCEDIAIMRDSYHSALKEVNKICDKLEKENESLRRRIDVLEAALKNIRTATLSDESDRNKIYGCNIIAREALKQSEHDFMKG